MTSKPYVGVRIQLRHVGVKLDGGTVVYIVVPERFDQACLIAGIGGRGAVAYLTPEVLSSLGTAATEEQIVVHLVLGRGAFSVEDSRGSAFQSYENGGIVRVCKNMAPKTISLPTKALRIVETISDILPLSIFPCFNVCIGRRSCQRYNGLSVCHVRSENFVQGPL